MAITGGVSASVASTGANGPNTTAAIDTTGATMIEITVAWYVGASVHPSVTDNKGNTYSPVTGIVAGVGAAIRKWYLQEPIVGTGHTFTANHTGGYAVLMVRAYAGSGIQVDAGAWPGSANGTTHASAADLYAGQILPSENGALITSAICLANHTFSGMAVDGATGGGTLALIGQHNYVASQTSGAAYADQVQTTATLSNHHYSWTPNGLQVALCTVAYVEGGSPGPAPESENNLLTGDGHTVEGSNDLIAGVTGTLAGNRSVLFSLDGAANSVSGYGTFWVFGNTIIEGAFNVNGSPLVTFDVSAELDGLGTQMAALLSKVGVIVQPASTGDTVVTGVGFEAKAIIFWGFSANNDPGFNTAAGSDLQWSLGWWTNGSNTENEVARNAVSEDNVGVTDTNGVFELGLSIAASSPDNFQSGRASVSAVGSDGFTLTWTNVSGNPKYWNYLAFGGDDLLVHADSFTAGVGTGVSVEWPSDQPDFTPSFLFFIDSTGDPNFTPQVGFTDGVNNCAYALFTQGSGAGTSNTGRIQRTDRCIIGINSAGAVSEGAFCTGFQPQGFFLTVDTSTVEGQFLALGAVNAHVGSFTLPTTAPEAVEITGLGFSPAAVFCASVGAAATASPQTENRVSMGATDGTGSVVGALHDTHGAGTTINATYQNGTAIVASMTAAATNASSTIEALATLQEFTTDGFIVAQSVTDGVAREVIYFALEGVEIPPEATERNLLTGDTHTVTGSDNLIAGVTGTLEGDRSVLFSLDGDAHSVTGDGTFWIYGDMVVSSPITVNGSPMTAIDLSAELDGLGT